MFEVCLRYMVRMKMQCKGQGSMFSSLKRCFALNPNSTVLDELVLEMFPCRRSLVCNFCI